MKYYVTIWLATIAASVWSREIPKATLDQLIKLIKQYEDSVEIDSKSITRTSSSTSNSPFLQDVMERNCGLECRRTVKECFYMSDTHDGRAECIETFLASYAKCYFGESKGCHDCLLPYDRCMFHSNLVEQYICYNGRLHCSKQCNTEITKRGCHENCDGIHSQCIDVVGENRGVFNIFICSSAIAACKDNCL